MGTATHLYATASQVPPTEELKEIMSCVFTMCPSLRLLDCGGETVTVLDPLTRMPVAEESNLSNKFNNIVKRMNPFSGYII